MFVSVENASAQAFMNTNTESGGVLVPAEDNTSSGGLLQGTDPYMPSGGVLVPVSGGENPSGGMFTPTSQNTLSGGNVSGLQELDKPNLTIVGITNWFIQIFNYIAILLFSAALVVFLYGVFLLMFVGGTNDESRSKGRKFMFWGIVSLFVMTSTWGLVNVLKSSIFGSAKPLLGPQFK